jgi:hypothetical protein
METDSKSNFLHLQECGPNETLTGGPKMLQGELMKAATNDQIREIRLIASEKLSALKDRSQPAEFERLPKIATQQVGSHYLEGRPT